MKIMEIIQKACERLASHTDRNIREEADKIAAADRDRDAEATLSEARLSTAQARVKTLNATLKRKEAQIKELQRTLFGQKSEKGAGSKKDQKPDDGQKSDDGQTGQNPEIKAPHPQNEKKPRGRQGRQKAADTSHLRRQVVNVEPEPGQFCSCGCHQFRMGEQVIEKLAYKPAEVYVIEERYPKYTCRNCDRFVQAKVPERAFDYSRFDDSMTTGILVSKYGDFLPLFRLEQIFGRSGVEISRSTLGRLAERANDILGPIHQALIADMRSSTKLFMDETTMPMLDPGRGKTKTCFAWAMCRDDRRWRGNRPPAVAFRFALSREGLHAERFLENYSGILQVDGYAGYNRLTSEERPGGPLTLAYCWAHARRKFFNAWKADGSQDGHGVVQEIDRLFENERTIWGQVPQVRLAERKRLSEPIVETLFPKLQDLSTRCLSESKLGEAISYTVKRKEGLGIFLSDGCVEMDNNPVENTIRPLALLRKNALFAGSEFGGELMAIVSSLIATCKMNGVEPHAYFTWVFEKVAGKLPLSEYHTLLPWNCPIGRFAPKEACG